MTRVNQGLFSTTMEAEKRDPGNEVAGEIRKALPILLFYSHVSGGISEAFSLCTYY